MLCNVVEIEEIDSASAQVCNRMKQIAATHAKMLHEKEQLDQLLGQQEKELTLLRKGQSSLLKPYSPSKLCV